VQPLAGGPVEFGFLPSVLLDLRFLPRRGMDRPAAVGASWYALEGGDLLAEPLDGGLGIHGTMIAETKPNAYVDYVDATTGEFIKRREFIDPYMHIEKGRLVMGYNCGAPNDLGWEQLRIGGRNET